MLAELVNLSRKNIFQVLLTYVHATLEIITLSFKLGVLHENGLIIKMTACKALE
jgi:hypothetical protein